MEQEAFDPFQSTLLFVDDEQNILSALKRLFRSEGYRIFTATSGNEALSILQVEPVDLVVSDMRMPGMDGATFLSHVADNYPDVVRILLTGYADIESTVRAVNEGSIYKYVSKPWEDNDIKLTIHRAIETKQLQKERDHLLELTNRQNAELKALNANLEKKVEARTVELRTAHESLRRNYFSSIKAFSNLIGMRGGELSAHSKRVAEMAQKVAAKLGMDKEAEQQVFFASLLHDIGKVSLSDELIRKPFSNLSLSDRAEYIKHPMVGDVLLMSFEPLREAAKMIRCHHEYLDGSGYPGQLSGDAIPLGARILTVVNDYDGLIHGKLIGRRLTVEEAREYMLSYRGRRYDPKVVDAFLGERLEEIKTPKRPSANVDVNDLRPGMILAQDLVTRQGILALSEGYVLDEHLIDKIRRFCNATGELSEVRVYMKRVGK